MALVTGWGKDGASISEISVGVGETVTVTAYLGSEFEFFRDTMSTADTSIATASWVGSGWTATVTIIGVSPGTTETALIGGYDTQGSPLAITVLSAEDESYLNKRGLAHFWENIDDIKQDKLTAGAGISITGNTISATGGGTADAVDWGHITGSMSDQTDLTTALAAKANSADLATVATSGDYDDLTDKPTIGNATLTIQKNGTSAGTFTANATSNKTINITVPTTAADVSALPTSTKYGASIAVSINTTDYKVTTTLKDQDGNTLGTAQVIDLPLESVVVNGSYDNTNKKIILTLQNGNTIDIPVADLVAGLQSEITSNNKLSSDLVDDTNHTHKFVTAAQITKLNGIASGAEVNVQADWTESNSSSDAYIQNKPSLATVATSGSYDDLGDKPTIPTATSELVNDSGFVTSDTRVTQTLTAPYSFNATYYPVASAISATDTGSVVKFEAMRYSQYADSFYGNAELTLGLYDSANYRFLQGRLSLVSDQDSNGWKTTFCAPESSAGADQLIYAPVGVDTSLGGRLVASYSMGSATGSATNPVYADAQGILRATTYALNKTVPSDAVFTDTTYSDATTSASGLMSASDKTKLNGIASGAEVNVQSDWSVTSSTSDAFIKNKPTLATVATSGSYNDLSNKPTIPTVNNATLTIQKNGTNVQTFTANAASNKTANITVPTATSELTNDSNFVSDASYVHTDNNYTTAEKNKLAGIAAGAEVNQNAFSNIKVGATTVAADAKTDTLELVAGSNVTITPDATDDTVTIAATDTTYSNATTSAAGLMSAADKTKLNGIATGAEVNVQSDWSATDTTSDAFIKNKPTLAAVATSGSYNDLSNRPTIPTVNNATLTITQNGTSVGTFTANASSNKTIAVTDTTYDNATTSTAGLMSAADKTKLNGIATGAEVNVQSDWSQTDNTADDYIKSKPTLATVATSGSYNDLSNKPTIPTVNNATLTIQKNGTTVKTFTANASSNVTANITVPTALSDLSGTVSSSQIAGSAVTTAKIDSGAITTVKIADANVTNAKLALDADFSTPQRIGKFGNEILYKLVFTDTSASAVNTWKALSTTLDMTNFVRIVSIKGVIHGGGTTEYYPMNADSANFIVYFSNGTFSERHSSSYYNSRAITVEVEFTRSA